MHTILALLDLGLEFRVRISFRVRIARVWFRVSARFRVKYDLGSSARFRVKVWFRVRIRVWVWFKVSARFRVVLKDY